MLAVLLTAFALRLPLLNAFSLREDEAIYSYWALHALHHDPHFLTVWPDKPPLYLWMLAGAFRLFGDQAAAARLTNILVSTFTVAVLAATAARLWGRQAGWSTAVVAALNPFAISFAPTAFTDPLLVLTGALSLYCASTERPFWLGVWLGGAIMTKQQGLFFVPLAMGAAWLLSPGLYSRRAGDLLYSLAGLALVVLPIVYWDSLRWAVAPSPWDLSLHNYAPLRMLPITVWGTRWAEWRGLLWYLQASSAAWAFCGLLLCAGAASAVLRRQPEQNAAQDRVAWWLLLWSGGFLAIHLGTTAAIWDRYLLPLAVVPALLTGWAVARLSPRCSLVAMRLITVLLAATMAAPAWSAAHGLLPIGSDHGAYAGLEESLAEIRRTATVDAPVILYHNLLGWHLQFYLFAAVDRGLIQLRWFPSSTYLADNVEKTSRGRKLFLTPEWADQRDLALRLAMRGAVLPRPKRFGQMVLYEMQAAPRASCTWCVCRPGRRWGLRPIAETSETPATAVPGTAP